MNKDINNLREITDSVLKDIKVTDELKSLTLKKCREEKKYNIKPIFITAASAAIMAFSVFSYKFILHNPNLTRNNNSKEVAHKSVSLNDHNNDHSSDKSNIAKQDNLKNNVVNNENQSKTTAQQNDRNTTLKNNQSGEKTTSSNSNKSSKLEDSTKDKTSNKTEEIKPTSNLPENKTANKAPENSILNNSTNKINDVPANSTLNKELPSVKASLDAPKSTTIADAENFWGGKILTPSYVPEGFELTDISIPKDNSKEICVKLNYSFENIYFKIVQNKSTTYTSYVGTSVDIKGSKAYVSKSKDANNPSLTITEIKWITNNIQYTITGNLPESELTKILNSIN
ncbi:DUF4367 domain-containing protein [Clostridium sp. OS1-26]|uniref:DUF4367 domain-containing protein n=1 Tax=Clostridium sp. OS1-26 TaxID=3070681 RepID=UPI0027E2016B|nr:DUF4367 domain-containing protein [Clostridium sp. OS1-26]WML33692.1 DUF4367 domain-containing protein [Clostridium sp. OS1-26]